MVKSTHNFILLLLQKDGYNDADEILVKLGLWVLYNLLVCNPFPRNMHSL